MVEDSEVDTRDETGNDDAPTASHNASASAYSVRGEKELVTIRHKIRYKIIRLLSVDIYLIQRLKKWVVVTRFLRRLLAQSSSLVAFTRGSTSSTTIVVTCV